jgi:hypothetical protein
LLRPQSRAHCGGRRQLLRTKVDPRRTVRYGRDIGDNFSLAAAELGSQPTYLGPRNSRGHVAPDLLFRGAFPGETLGPYLCQLLLQPTFFGSQPIGQQQVT